MTMDARVATWLLRLDARIEREIARLRARYQLSLDEFRGLYVSDEQVDRVLAATDDAPAAPPAHVDRPTEGARDSAPRWKHLVETFGLSELDQDLLFIACAPELEPKYETLYAYLNNDVTRKWPTAELASRLLADVASRGAVVAALAPGSLLRTRGLVAPITSGGHPALLNSGYAAAPAVAHWLHGRAALLALDPRTATCFVASALPEFDDTARARAERLALLGQRTLRGNSAVVALLGRDGSGRASTAAALAALTRRALVRFDLRACDGEHRLADALRELAVAVGLTPAVVLVEGFESLAEDDARSRPRSLVAAALAELPRGTAVLFRTSDDEPWRACAARRRVLEVQCDANDFAARLLAWKRAAAAEGVTTLDPELERIAGQFAFSAGQVRAALATARDLAALSGGEVNAGHVASAARITSDHALGRLAAKVESGHDWSELVLPADTLQRLKELTAAIRNRHVVFGAWGFGERSSSGAGVKAMFAGTSGTGKTMAAGVIARELALDLYKVDLSGVVSKYIGETEKNLGRIFRAARAANAILFLDEAEALLGKRSEVKDAHDRYANVEVAYLLQRLEEHDGIVIVATNLKRNMDDAFSRRLQYIVDFPRPGEAERERIWRGTFPERAPLAPDIDFPFLARQFELAGGDIRNVALDAAFLAAEDGTSIDMRMLVEAVSRQLAKQGKASVVADFRQYQPLLSRRGATPNGS
jgi:AAA+ superfamily predicted ATPase